MITRRRFRSTASMLLLILCGVLLSGCGSPSIAQSVAAPATSALATPQAVVETPAPSLDASTTDIAALSDEFDNADTLAQWHDHATVDGWPTWIEQADINTTSPGHLYLVPATSGWFEDFRGVFLFKEVTGDFDVATRIEITGKQTALPTRTFSLSGLMARAPRTVTPATWQTKHENWVFITTGYGDNHPRRAGKPQIETKTTVNSKSALVLKAIPDGWVDLRIVRVGDTFSMLYRTEGNDWQLSRRYTRPDLPPTLQVGLNAYSSWGVDGGDPFSFNSTADPAPGDLIARVDYVRFQRPTISDALKAKIAQGTIKDAELIAELRD